MFEFQEELSPAHYIKRRKPIYGVAINDSPYKSYIKRGTLTIPDPVYTIYREMLKRCYDPKYREKFPTYTGCSVCPEWLLFTTFKAWVLTQDWKGLQLDKDILKLGNKVYSPATCCFVSNAVNSLLNSVGATRGEYPLGVDLDRLSGRYRAQISMYGQKRLIGKYATVPEATLAYNKAKASYIIEVAATQPIHIQQGLLKHAALFLE